MTAWWTAGRLGDGGGPGTRGGIFPRLRPAMRGEAEMLQSGEGDAGHQGVPVQPSPGSALEVAEVQLPLELLVRLLAHPTRLDGGDEGAERYPGRQIAEVVLALAARTQFADQPNLVAGQVAAVGPGGAIGHPHASGLSQ